MTYSVILLPGILFLAGVAVALNVLLRDKYLAYAVSIGTGAALYYLFSQGYNHWLYNPVLYQLWRYSDLTEAGSIQTILIQRLYCLGIATAGLSLAHLFFQRKSTGVLTGRGLPITILIVSVALTVIAGLYVAAK